MLHVFIKNSAVNWTAVHNEYLVRKIPVVYKQSTAKIGEACKQLAEILNVIVEPKFKVTQRAVRERYTFFLNHSKKMKDKFKESRINYLDLTDTKVVIRDVMEKFATTY